MKPKPKKPIPFLKEQQELAALFEPEEVAQYFRDDSTESKEETPSLPADTRKKTPPEK